MPYDPNYPATNAPLQSAPLRTQLNELNNDIQTRATTGDMNAAISAAVADKVSNSQLTTAIANTAVNPGSVTPISGSFGDPDLNQVKDKLNELIAAQIRMP